ncbi:MAG: TolC family protein, partial [Caulobacteraceae bacterium]
MATSLEARTLDDPRLGAFLTATAPATANGRPVWDLEALTLAAVYFHPDLQVAYAKLATARAAVITARERPNPTVDLSGAYNTLSPPVSAGLAVNFLLETFGKRGDRTERARDLARAARQDITTEAWQVRGGVRGALLDLWAAQRRIVLGRRRLQMEAELVGLLERRLAVGEASALDVARERVNRDQFAVAVGDAERAAATARAQLAPAVGVPARALDGVDIDLEAFDGPPGVSPEISQGELRRRALTGRSDVQSSLAQYTATEAALKLAIANQYPNLTLSPGYSHG